MKALVGTYNKALFNPRGPSLTVLDSGGDSDGDGAVVR